MSYFEKRNCPYCGSECEADWVDVGVGFVQCGPYYCENCRASEIGLYDDIGFDSNLIVEHMKKCEETGIDKPFILPDTATITDEEFETGWFKPGSPLGSTVNTHNGEYVDHKTARELYKQGLLDEK